MSKVDQQNKV